MFALNRLPKIDKISIKRNISIKSCLACANFRGTHPRTSLSYCIDGSKIVMVDTGCNEWKVDPAVQDYVKDN